MFKKKNLSEYSLEKLIHVQERTRLIRYVFVGIGFLVAIIVIDVILEFYQAIPDVDDSVVSFLMSQSIFVVLVLAALLISLEFYMAGQFNQMKYNQIEIIKMLKQKEKE